MVKIGWSLFVKELILFAATLSAGLYSAYFYSLNFTETIQGGVSFTITDLVILIIIGAAILYISRHKRVAKFSFRLFLVLIVFSGTQVLLGSLVSPPWDLVITIIFAVVFSFGINVLVHNIGVIAGIAGIGAVFGLSISAEFGLILLVALSVYDIVAVYITKHMVTMAKSMVESGAVFGFLIPFEFKGFFYGKNEAHASVGENFMVLGSGDIGLPVVFVSSLVATSVTSAIVTAVFSIFGLFITHLIFINQKTRKAMAALPPIATMTIIGYLVSQLW